MKRFILPLVALFILFAFKADRSRTITGTVTSLSQLPIPGALISAVKGKQYTTAGSDGKFSIRVDERETQLKFSFVGYKPLVVPIKGKTKVDAVLVSDGSGKDEILITAGGVHIKRREQDKQATVVRAEVLTQAKAAAIAPLLAARQAKEHLNTESYAGVKENGFYNVLKDPLSTFSIDVDAASYTNIRRHINSGTLPPADAVRIEEMINYFDYNYPQPTGNDPVNIITEMGDAPWSKGHKLVQIGLKAKQINTTDLPASNLVFLIDVSGSMYSANKLPLLVSSFKLLTDQLRPKDKVAIVVYAGSSGVVLPATSGSEKTKIKDALEKLQAGGSTAGGAGIKLAYKIAGENFVSGGNNRIILATDGDFNVGASSDADMEKLIEQQRKTGVFLTVLGFGMGNYKDSKMEILANKGNGNYAYIDNISEARKVLVNEFGGTLFTVAKDVKLQVEFNPAKVAAYRLIGYENRLLQKEDFNNDVKDAGEMGAGHTVTALYEVIPAGVKSSFLNSVDDLKYQNNVPQVVKSTSSDLMTVKLRYKQPDGNTSKLITRAVQSYALPFEKTSNNFRFAASIAEFGMLLRNSDFKQQANFDAVLKRARGALGDDNEGYRAEFLTIVRSAKLMAVDLLTLKDKKIMHGTPGFENK